MHLKVISLEMKSLSSWSFITFILLGIIAVITNVHCASTVTTTTTITTTTTTTTIQNPQQPSTSAAGSNSTTQVIVPPLITLEPVINIAFSLTESIELPCAASGQPQPTYSWTRNEIHFDPSDTNGRITIQPGVGTLIFADPEPIDEAIYQCFAKNAGGTALSVKVNFRQATLSPFETNTTKVNYPNLGDSLQLKCIPPASFPPAEVYWVMISEGSRFTPLDYTDRISIDPIGNLDFVTIVRDDFKNNATYACVVENRVMRSTQIGQCNKIYPSGVTSSLHAPDVMWQPPTQQLGLRGGTLSVKCIFSGNPTPRVSWTRVSPINASIPNDTVIESFGQQLTLQNLQYQDAGVYECQAINDEEFVPIRRSVTLVVQSSPYWVTKPTSVDISEGENATFTCIGESIPEPSYFWSIRWSIWSILVHWNGVPLTEFADDPRRTSTRNTLTYTNVTVNDTMVIQCNVTNKYGYNFTNAYLNVLEQQIGV